VKGLEFHVCSGVAPIQMRSSRKGISEASISFSCGTCHYNGSTSDRTCLVRFCPPTAAGRHLLILLVGTRDPRRQRWVALTMAMLMLIRALTHPQTDVSRDSPNYQQAMQKVSPGFFLLLCGGDQPSGR
jgi:hypothetical protein